MTAKLAVITFLFEQPRAWRQLARQPYNAKHVNAAYRMMRDNLKIPHRFICLTDQPEGIVCETMPVWPAIHVNGEDGCYRKVRAFDAGFQRSIGEWILCTDLDFVALKDLTPLVTFDADCRMLDGSRDLNGNQVSFYNGSLWLCRAGARDYIWKKFDPTKFYDQRRKVIMHNGKRIQGTDQSWFSIVSPGEKVWKTADGVTQYYMHRRGEMPEETRMLFFAGPRKAWGKDVAANHPALAETWRSYTIEGQRNEAVA